MDNFFGPFLSRVRPGMKVLDLGAGHGTQAAWMVSRGARVVAVDKKEPPPKLHGSIRWLRASIEDWFAALPEDARYDAILAKNSLQFINRDWVLSALLPTLKDRLKPGGIMALQTFYRSPEPPFEWVGEISHYTVSELVRPFLDWRVIAQRQAPKIAKGPDGIRRKFYLSGIIVQKKPSQ